MREAEGLGRLVAIMDRLRDPGGCPWDREQDYRSLRRFLLEECYEAVEALDREDLDGLREELGDLLFQIVFLSRLAREQGRFTIDDVVREVGDKLVRRHPHVFGTATAETAAEVERAWERIKREEQGPAAPPSVLDGVALGLPALPRAQRLGERAASAGFDWERLDDVFEQVEGELGELRAALRDGDPAEVRDELGDVLFSVVMLARRLEVDAEAALARTNLKFSRRFRWIERELAGRGVALGEAGMELLERLWQESKSAPDARAGCDPD